MNGLRGLEQPIGEQVKDNILYARRPQTVRLERVLLTEGKIHSQTIETGKFLYCLVDNMLEIHKKSNFLFFF